MAPAALRSHVQQSHGHKERKFSCTYCKFTAYTKCVLECHVNGVHTREKSYRCDICCKEFFHPSSFKNHKRQMHGSKTYMCDICSKQFRRPAGLRNHMLSHTGERPYVCELCDYTALRSGDLNRHVRTKHPNNGTEPSYVN